MNYVNFRVKNHKIQSEVSFRLLYLAQYLIVGSKGKDQGKIFQGMALWDSLPIINQCSWKQNTKSKEF